MWTYFPSFLFVFFFLLCISFHIAYVRVLLLLFTANCIYILYTIALSETFKQAKHWKRMEKMGNSEFANYTPFISSVSIINTCFVCPSKIPSVMTWNLLFSLLFFSNKKKHDDGDDAKIQMEMNLNILRTSFSHFHSLSLPLYLSSHKENHEFMIRNMRMRFNWQI